VDAAEAAVALPTAGPAERRAATAARNSLAAEERSHAFLVAVLRAATIGPDGEDCPVCLDPLLGDQSITRCGHRFHRHCLQPAGGALTSCPSCRGPITGAHRPLHISTSADDPEARRHGSKLARIAAVLASLRADDPSAKALVFVQWDELVPKVHAALAPLGALRLKGGVAELSETLRRFHAEPDAAALVLSLEKAPTGLNLTAAGHIFFVHPVVKATAREAVDFEDQALARALRPGQLRDVVTAWSFLAADTVEVPRHRDTQALRAREEARARERDEPLEQTASSSSYWAPPRRA
jgi:hypothetical protein